MADIVTARASRLAKAGLAGVLLLLHVGCGAPVDRLRARVELKKGNQSYLAGDHKAAIEHYHRALAHVPTLSRAYLNCAYSQVTLFRASADPEERRVLADSAVASFQRYVALLEGEERDGGEVPKGERIERHILTLYLDSGQADKASALLEARLQRHPRDMATLQMLANLAVESGELDEALRWHRKRLELEPTNHEGYYALAVMAWQFSYHGRVAEERRQELLDEGLGAVKRALELRPDYFEALIYANLLYREKAKFAATDAERAEFEKLYTEFEERARQVREQQKNAT